MVGETHALLVRLRQPGWRPLTGCRCVSPGRKPRGAPCLDVFSCWLSLMYRKTFWASAVVLNSPVRAGGEAALPWASPWRMCWVPGRPAPPIPTPRPFPGPERPRVLAGGMHTPSWVWAPAFGRLPLPGYEQFLWSPCLLRILSPLGMEIPVCSFLSLRSGML